MLAEYRKQWKPNPDGYLFTTKNNRPPSSNKVVEYQLWPILDALGIERCDSMRFVIPSHRSLRKLVTQLKWHGNSGTPMHERPFLFNKSLWV